MFCDCILGRSGFQTGYIAVYVISAFFIMGAVAVLMGGWRTANYKQMEDAKNQILEVEG